MLRLKLQICWHAKLCIRGVRGSCHMNLPANYKIANWRRYVLEHRTKNLEGIPYRVLEKEVTNTFAGRLYL